ncbi:unnamed protein product, partial [Prorocentrum cordatum]
AASRGRAADGGRPTLAGPLRDRGGAGAAARIVGRAGRVQRWLKKYARTRKSLSVHLAACSPQAEPSASAREATRGQHFTSRSSEAYRSPTELSAHSGRQPGRQLALPKNGLWVEWSLLARRWSTISSLGDRWERGRERARNNRRGRREGGLR